LTERGQSNRGEHNGPYSERRLSGGDGLIIPARVDVPQDRYPVVNWLIIAGAIAVFVLQTLSVWEREEQLPAMTKKYENVSIEDMAKEFEVKERELKKIEKAVEKGPVDIEDVSVIAKSEPGQLKEALIKQIILEQYYVQGGIRPYILNGFALKGLFGYMWLHAGIIHLLGNMLFCGYSAIRFAQK
jgi:membrane associated rhomboid family serine protease